ncbi:LPS export ABC transporter periplasmic protein LptC [Sphingomonas lenta]|uniref:LPS export ABC transporter periplasmic protein LptC n=1 Tax=Sphingomonas lenta TaxID=1141887 RepID=A0A2A2SEA4_9SPHN|nr:LPS export ABC transporter periplasmic protein LptC [Sphingomonas lenta]PAX07568.1 LPS export ABC transporter periplasmic protein LptC [Sphingomonas lenta]
MSEQAVAARTARQRMAAPGSAHDKLIGLLRVGLPMAVGVLAAFLVMAPLTSAGDVSFVLDKNEVEVARERLRIQAARYRGQDARGRPFVIDAGSAVQRSSAEPVVRMEDLAARLQLSEGPATIAADQGVYRMDTEQVRVDGPVRVRAADGYRLDTTDAVADLRTRRLTSTGRVTGATSQGTFSADTMRADLESRTVRLQGNARLRIDP